MRVTLLFLTSLIFSALFFYRFLDNNFIEKTSQVLNASISGDLTDGTVTPTEPETLGIMEIHEQNQETEIPTLSPTETPTPKAKKNTPTPKPTLKPTAVLTPTPSVTPSPTATIIPTLTQAAKQAQQPQYSSEQINGFIDRFAGQYGVDANVLRHIAVCESGFNASAVNGPYAGLYQYSSSTWISNRSLIGEDTNPDLRLNAEEAVQTAAYMVSAGKSYVWPNCTP